MALLICFLSILNKTKLIEYTVHCNAKQEQVRTRNKQENIAMIVGSSCKCYCFSCNREYFVRNAEYPCFYNRISLLVLCSTLFGIAVYVQINNVQGWVIYELVFIIAKVTNLSTLDVFHEMLDQAFKNYLRFMFPINSIPTNS